jgi:RNA polymerase primary sigma factor
METEIEFGSVIADNSRSIEDEVAQADQSSCVRDLIESYLQDPEWRRGAYILIRRFRIGEADSGDIRTLNEIGRELNLTRERVRQVQESFIKHLREAHPEMMEWL